MPLFSGRLRQTQAPPNEYKGLRLHDEQRSSFLDADKCAVAYLLF